MYIYYICVKYNPVKKKKSCQSLNCKIKGQDKINKYYK